MSGMKFVREVKVGDRVKVEGIGDFRDLPWRAGTRCGDGTVSYPGSEYVSILMHSQGAPIWFHLRNIVEIVECGPGNCEFTPTKWKCPTAEDWRTRGTSYHCGKHEAECEVIARACTRCGKREEQKIVPNEKRCMAPMRGMFFCSLAGVLFLFCAEASR